MRKQDLHLRHKQKANPGVQLPVKVLYEENGNYVVEVKELSPNWGALAFDIYNKNSENEQMDIRKFTQDVNEYEEENALQKVRINLFRQFLPIKEKQKQMMNC